MNLKERRQAIIDGLALYAEVDKQEVGELCVGELYEVKGTVYQIASENNIILLKDGQVVVDLPNGMKAVKLG